MVKLQSVRIEALSPQRLESVIGPGRAAHFDEQAAIARELLAGRAVINVNSTATGGGVAEMLQTLLAYARGAGVDAQWWVFQGEPDFFGVTKRLHNGLYGSPGDGGGLGPAEQAIYERVTRTNADELLAFVRPGDIVLVHDPQPAGLCRAMREAGALVVWRCHVGLDRRNEWSERAWEFVRPHVEPAHAFVFSRREFAPPWMDPSQVHVIPPSIDPFSPKNEHRTLEEAHAILRHAGFLTDPRDLPVPGFTRRDGSPGRIDSTVDLLQSGPPPGPDAPLIVQVSRWDAMKDMGGVMEAFAEHVDGRSDAHLMLVGPSVSGVADDPEGGQVLDACEQQWRDLPAALRRRVHLACIPMHDADENAAITNAIQTHARIITQKSIAEGFGLTVAEAMFKGKPVVASAVGGIVDQVVHGETGLLLDDPHDLETFGRHLRTLLDDPPRADRMGAAGRQRAIDEFLGDRHLEQYAALFADLLAREQAGS